MLPDEKVDIYAAQIMQTPLQLKQAIDQMLFTGESVAGLDFSIPPGAAPPHRGKVFHPEGGGLSTPRLPAEGVAQDNTDPVAGWYVGSFEDIEWTLSNAPDVIATAHQISEQICARINEKLTGSATIPTLGAATNTLLIDATESSAGGNIRFTSAQCAACYGQPSLCVKDNANDAWSFYSILVSE